MRTRPIATAPAATVPTGGPARLPTASGVTRRPRPMTSPSLAGLATAGERALDDQLFVLGAVLLSEQGGLDASVDPRPVHREDGRLEVHVVEVPGEEHQRGQRGLVAVRDLAALDEAGGQPLREPDREPAHQA